MTVVFSGDGRRWNVFYHFVGAVPGSTSLQTALQRLLREMNLATVRGRGGRGVRGTRAGCAGWAGWAGFVRGREGRVDVMCGITGTGIVGGWGGWV